MKSERSIICSQITWFRIGVNDDTPSAGPNTSARMIVVLSLVRSFRRERTNIRQIFNYVVGDLGNLDKPNLRVPISEHICVMDALEMDILNTSMF